MVVVATWNVNSIRSRVMHLEKFLREESPDILCLQELKCLEKDFPKEFIEDLGYNLAISGQKTYNGVAILSKLPIDEVITNFPEDPDPSQARYIEVVCSDSKGRVLRVVSVYVPNGGEVDSEKFHYKLEFLDSFYRHLNNILYYDEVSIFAGDYNVAAYPIDVYNHEKLFGSTCYHPDEQRIFRSILNLGISDNYRELHPQESGFTWWDYRGLAFQHNLGMRIDYVLSSPQAFEKTISADLYQNYRALDKASDHIPISVTLNL